MNLTTENDERNTLFDAVRMLLNESDGERYCLRGKFTVSEVSLAEGWGDVKVTLVNGHKNKEKVNEEPIDSAQAGDV